MRTVDVDVDAVLVPGIAVAADVPASVDHRHLHAALRRLVRDHRAEQPRADYC